MEKKSTADIFMSILPEDALDIGRSRKTTVSRSYPLPATVRRIWFYTTSPLQYIEYVVCISYNETESNISKQAAHIQLQHSPGMDVEAAYLLASGYRARYTESSPEKVLLGD
ncbi:hypothetical protein N7536_009300 [Penicillium majusculum]|nr:hypothetical protein N7536_009300 [Penicillium majusculum]